MARRTVCLYAACVLICVFVIPPSDSERQEDNEVKYAVAGVDPSFLTHLHSIDNSPLLRARRQAPVSSNNSDAITTVGPTTPQPADTTPKTTQAPQSPTPAPTQAPPATTPAPTTTTATKTTPARTAEPPTVRPSVTNPPAMETSTETRIMQDNHNYYISTIMPDSSSDYFIELVDPTRQETLSSGHRVAVTINLPFPFRFYGHNITNITVATGGFIYMSPFLHQWLTATQYIAPLMANFDTTDQNSHILYKQIGDEFVVEWRDVILKDQSASGKFIFQAKLKSDGTITFVYKTLPVPVGNISSSNHPVKIGLSDAFYNDTFLPAYGVKRRTIIEYHRVSFLPAQVEEGTVIILQPVPTCNIISDCETCARHVGVKFDCKWCDKVQRCSDGLDWYRQDWETKGCNREGHAQVEKCAPFTPKPSPTTTPIPAPTTTPKPTIQTAKPVTTKTPNTSAASAVGAHDCSGTDPKNCRTKQDTPVAVIVVVVIIVVALMGAAGIWVFYAYTHPTSSSGIWLMEHRPSAMKAKIANIKFWKSSTPAGTKYAVESEA